MTDKDATYLRLGRAAVKKGWLTEGELSRSLKELEMLSRAEIKMQLGEYLVEKCAITPAQLREILAEQGKRQMRCTDERCGTRYTLTGFVDNKRYRCKKCGATLADVPDTEPDVKSDLEVGYRTAEFPRVEREIEPEPEPEPPRSPAFCLDDGVLGGWDRALLLAELNANPMLLLRIATYRGQLKLSPAMHVRLRRCLKQEMTVTSALRKLIAERVFDATQADDLLQLETVLHGGIDELFAEPTDAQDAPVCWAAMMLGLLDHASLLSLLLISYRETPPKPIDEALLESDVLDSVDLSAALEAAEDQLEANAKGRRSSHDTVALDYSAMDGPTRRVSITPSAGLRDSVLNTLDMEPGSWVGKYRLERRLGRGGMAAVYLARADGVPCAFKLLLPQMATQQEYMRRFERESKFTRQLDHPGIVKVLDAGLVHEHGVPYIVMEYIEGSTLAENIDGRMPLPIVEVVAILEQLVEALGYAHGKGILHRDIKPENVLLTGSGGLKLADFGLVKDVGTSGVNPKDHLSRIVTEFRQLIVKVRRGEEETSLGNLLSQLRESIVRTQRATPTGFERAALSRFQSPTRRLSKTVGLTKAGECLGTPHYMSPEQFVGHMTDGRTDIYSLGVLAYYLITGAFPWEGNSLTALGLNKIQNEALPIYDLRPGCPLNLAQVVHKMIRRHPEERYPTTEFLRNDLARTKHGWAPLLEPVGWLDEAVRRKINASSKLEANRGHEVLVDLLLEFLEVTRVTDRAVN